MHSTLLDPSNALLTPAEMGRADALAAGAGVPGLQLMQAAGRAVARAAQRFGPCRTLVLCGPGNNGGDGWVAAQMLHQMGWPVRVAALAPPRPRSDASAAAVGWRGPWGEPSAAEAARADLVIDAAYGAGLRGALPDAVAAVLAAARRVLAVDVPSGLDGATGQPLGRVRAADLTVTFFRLKPGHLLLPGRTLCGRVLLGDIGLPDAVLSGVVPQAWRNTPGLWRLPGPGADSHKYARGHVTVLGGAAMTGAARLAAGAARRAGAGMVSVAALGHGDLYRSGDPGLVVTDASLAELLQDTRRTVWVCGPGLGLDAARAALPPLLAAGRQVIADADALGAHAGQPRALRGCAILTPHEGEFTRLFGSPGPDKPAAVRAAAAQCRCVVVLKGADTVIAAPDGHLAINDSAPPWLATAGGGDVLAGIAGALLAQGMPAWDAACAAAWLHGRAAALHGPGLIAEDLAPLIPLAIRAALGKDGGA